MAWKKHDYDSIPGTYVFNGETAHKAYALNKLLFSFNHDENRQEYARDPGAYADKFELPAEQKQASVIDLLDAYAAPMGTETELGIASGQYRELIRGYQDGKEIPHIDEPYFSKCLGDLRKLGLIRPATVASHAA